MFVAQLIKFGTEMKCYIFHFLRNLRLYRRTIQWKFNELWLNYTSILGNKYNFRIFCVLNITVEEDTLVGELYFGESEYFEAVNISKPPIVLNEIEIKRLS